MTNQTEQGAARPQITVELLHRVYRNTPEWAPYLRARFAEPGAKSFELDGHRWAYRCSSFDDAGEYDLLWRPDANPTSEGYTSDGAEPTALDDLEFRYIAACEERDHLRAELSKSQALNDCLLKSQQIQAARDDRHDKLAAALASAPAAGIDPASAPDADWSTPLTPETRAYLHDKHVGPRTPDDWRQYATEREETAQAVIERHRRELQTTGGMLAAARTRIAELEAVSAPAAEPYGWVYERADGFRMLHKAGDCQEAKLAADRDAAARYPDGHRLTTVYAAPTSDPQAQVVAWRHISDSEWVNIVNSPQVRGQTTADDAVAEAFKLIEAKLRELNEFRATVAHRAGCNSEACGWRGSLDEKVYLRGVGGGVGPLCPECRETVEVEQPVLPDLEALDVAFSRGVCVALQIITTMDCGTIWREVVRTCDEDKLLNFAAHVEPEEWELAGFAKYSRQELGRGRPAASAKGDA